MKLKEYKIETNGLNEAILHKAVEEGYEDEVNHYYLLKGQYLYLYANGRITWSDSDMTFKNRPFTQISAHDFLRLNWTPKVGEEVECVDDDSFANEYIQKSKKYKVIAIWKDVRGIKVKGPDVWFDLLRFIPIYPRKKQLRFKTEQEFIEEFGEKWRTKTSPAWTLDNGMDYLFGQPAVKENQYNENRWTFDNWIISDDMLTDKPLPEQKQEKPDAYISGWNSVRRTVQIIVRTNDTDKMLSVDLTELHEYNLLSESDYKAKYDKLMFKDWEVHKSMNPDGYLYSCGCVENINENDLIGFKRIYDLAKKHGVEPHEIAYFINDNRKTLGL